MVWIMGLVSLVALVVGTIAWLQEQRCGLAFESISNEVPWGLYIVIYFFLAGTGGGMLALASVPGAIAPEASRVIALLAFAFLVGSGFSILVDLGRPARAWRLVAAGRLTSPMFWDFIGLAQGVAVSFLLALWRPVEGSEAGYLRAAAGLISTLFLFGAEGWTLLIYPGKRNWMHPYVPLVLFAEGVISGGAVTFLLLKDYWPWLPILVAGLSVVLPLLERAEEWFLVGGLRPHFKLVHSNQLRLWMGLGALVLLLLGTESSFLRVAGGILLLIQAWIGKWAMVLIPQLQMPYEQERMLKKKPVYRPAVWEYLVVAGIFGLTGLLSGVFLYFI
ncbi:hypothetical protein SY88_12405 [Clostridiales bacterium PH28_bin88]|nr:hypothetical protein SY88_12405 [Clostridiales bacterium PH28_bin88]